MLVLDTIRKKYFAHIFTEILPNDSSNKTDKGKKDKDISKKEKKDEKHHFMV
jgi:hypothetical protein